MRLTFEQAQEIRSRHAFGETQTALAREYGVSQPALSKVILGKSHTSEPVFQTRDEELRARKDQRLRKKYGITLKEWEAMLEACGHRCEICDRHAEDFPPHHRSGKPYLMCDHDHKTGKVRGVLCSHCNFALGQVEDSVERLKSMIKYLERRKF